MHARRAVAITLHVATQGARHDAAMASRGAPADGHECIVTSAPRPAPGVPDRIDPHQGPTFPLESTVHHIDHPTTLESLGNRGNDGSSGDPHRTLTPLAFGLVRIDFERGAW